MGTLVQREEAKAADAWIGKDLPCLVTLYNVSGISRTRGEILRFQTRVLESRWKESGCISRGEPGLRG